MILTIVILSLLCIFLGYSTFNMLKKLEMYEETIEQTDESLVSMQEELQQVLNGIRKIDHRGIFENDDEVGQTFKQILKLIENLEKLQ
mgnify:FL=1